MRYRDSHHSWRWWGVCVAVGSWLLLSSRLLQAATLSGTIHYSGSRGPVSAARPILLFLLGAPYPGGDDVAHTTVSSDNGSFTLNAPIAGTYYLAYLLDVNGSGEPAVGDPYGVYSHRTAFPGDPINVPQSGIHLEFNDDAGLPGISGTVTYTGAHGPISESHPIYVGSFENPEFSGDPNDYAVITANGGRYNLFVFTAVGTRYLKAFADVSGNGEPDNGEPSTIYCRRSMPPGDPVSASPTQTNLNFTFGDDPSSAECTAPEATRSPTSSPTKSPTSSPTSSPTLTATAVHTPTRTPSLAPSPTPSPTPSITRSLTPSPTRVPTATPSPSPVAMPTVSVSGTCQQPGTEGLVACTAGTRVDAQRCGDRACSAERLSLLGSTLVDATGHFALSLNAASVTGQRLVFTAAIATARSARDASADDTDYRIVDSGDVVFGTVGELEIAPISEAATLLEEEYGLQNLTDEGMDGVLSAVRDANAGTSFAGTTARGAVTLAKQTASASPAVAVALQRARIGNCDGSCSVSFDEITAVVNVVLVHPPTIACRAGDANGDGEITIDEVVPAVSNGHLGCPAK